MVRTIPADSTSSAATAPAIAMEGLSFAYPGQVGSRGPYAGRLSGPWAPALKDITMRVARGEMVGLIGPNGGGKSTLLKLASGVLRPASGSIALLGDDLSRLRRDEVARRVAVVPQDFSVQFAYTVRQIVELGRTPHTGTWGVARPTDRAAVDAALAATGTTDLANRVFNELSGGERQRVLLALALAQSADLVLLDEPTAHLDIKHQIEILELLRRFNRERGLTVVAVLHDLNLAARYFARLVLFRHRVVADGPPAAVLDPDLLSQVYETPVQVGILRGEEHISVLPPSQGDLDLHPAAVAPVAAPGLHILAGGGSGELLMRALADAEIAFSAGPLNAGDSDQALAHRLASLCLTEPPYAPVSPEGLAAARERMLAASAVVVCPMPLGPGNIALLEGALAAVSTGVPVILLDPQAAFDPAHEPASTDAPPVLSPSDADAVAARDFSGRGPALYAALVQAGARWAASPVQVVALLTSSQPGVPRHSSSPA